jgi:glycine/D-amino acid oxidase-like deaminating enzyme
VLSLHPTERRRITSDQHPIIDTTDAGLVVGGFAGLGLMHAPAAGLLASELIADGRMNSIDSSTAIWASRGSHDRLNRVEQTGF